MVSWVPAKHQQNRYITIPDYDNLQQRKINTNDIMYWLVKFKDYMTNKTVLQRPEKPLPIKMYRSGELITLLYITYPGWQYITFHLVGSILLMILLSNLT